MAFVIKDRVTETTVTTGIPGRTNALTSAMCTQTRQPPSLRSHEIALQEPRATLQDHERCVLVVGRLRADRHPARVPVTFGRDQGLRQAACIFGAGLGAKAQQAGVQLVRVRGLLGLSVVHGRHGTPKMSRNLG